LADAITALGWWALKFTPKVVHLEDTLVLEVSASERLWGGRQQLLCQMFESTMSITDVQFAQGTTSLIAIARLQTAGQVHAAPNDLPLAALAAARPHLATLQRIGCTRWGQLRALPRGGVVRRFGASLLDALDQAYGLKPELYPWLMLPDIFEATLELGFQVETAPALLFGARRLFRQLQVWLQARHCGVLALELMWTMDARRDTATQGQLVLRTAEPTADMAHLQRLLSEHLARITLPAPVLYLHLRSIETKKLGSETASLLPDEQKTGDSLHHLLERLSARLGSQKVLQIKAQSDHRPELMQILLPCSYAANFKSLCSDSKRFGTESEVKEDMLYPTWLLLNPLKLAVRKNTPLYQGVLTLLAGPQRLEAGWWVGGDCALRDYFLARSEHAGLLWVYRERVPVQQGAEPGADVSRDWYLHGLFA
jgi:protein ImuB